MFLSLHDLHLVENSLGELVGRVLTTHVARADLAIGDDGVDRLRDPVRVVVEAEVTEEHASGEDQGTGVGLVLALDVETDVSAAGLENSDVAAHVAARHDTGATDQRSTNVGQNATVQVGHDHDVELLGFGDALHGGVVDDHVVGLNGGVFLGGLVEGRAEQTVGQLHDVGLVDASDLLAVVGESEAKGELGNALGLGTGDDLERLNDALDALVLQTGVFTFCVLTDDAHVDALVARLVAGDVLDQRNGGIDVELLSHGDVERLVARPLQRGVQNALETQLVTTQRRDGLFEHLLRRLRTVVQTSNINLLPLDGHVVGLEDGLDTLSNLGADTITGNEGDGVLAAILGRLEYVALNGGVGSGGDGGLVLLSGSAQEAL